MPFNSRPIEVALTSKSWIKVIVLFGSVRRQRDPNGYFSWYAKYDTSHGQVQ